MTLIETEPQSETIVTDSSVLMNFLCIDRVDLLAGYSHDFVAPDHVVEEVTDHYGDEQQRLVAAFDDGTILKTEFATLEEELLYQKLLVANPQGLGESAATAIAIRRQHALAMDDRRAIKYALSEDANLRVLTTEDLVVSMIREGLLDIAEADRIKDLWRDSYKFKASLNSFGDPFK